MNSPKRPSSSSSASQPIWKDRKLWLILGAAFVAGLLICAVLLLKGKDENEFIRGKIEKPAAAPDRFDPLPVPASDVGGEMPGLQVPSTEPDSSISPAASQNDPGSYVATPEATTVPVPPPAAPIQAPAGMTTPVKIISNPSPRYPASSLRRNETGEVLLRLHIDTRGRVASVDIVRSSSHTALDRAAVDAVKRWKFEPAMTNGQPVNESVTVPIAFAP